MRCTPVVLALAATLLAAPAFAGPAARSAPGYSWLSLNAGVVSGSVDVPCGASETDGGCEESGVFGTYGAALTLAGKGALRFRMIRANEDTENKPYETAALVGTRVGNPKSHWYALVGIGTIHNADDDYSGTATGLAWEILLAEPGSNFELSFNGNTGPDVDFVGASIGLRFGNR